MIAELLAAASSFLGIGCLFISWKEKDRVMPGLIWLGWGLLFLSSLFWIQASGPEFGTTYALTVPSLVVWLLIAGFYSKQQLARQKERPFEKLKLAQPKVVVAQFGQFLFVLPCLAIFCTLITLALVSLIPVAENIQLLLALLLLPTLWGGTAIWMSATKHKIRVLGISLAMAAASGLYLFL